MDKQVHHWEEYHLYKWKNSRPDMSDREENEKPQYRYLRRKKNKEEETWLTPIF